MTTLSNLYRTVRTRLTEAGIESAALDSRLLVEGVTGNTLEDIVCRPMREVTSDQADAVEQAVGRRIAGEPVHRILGWREFYGLKLSLSPETLEPRADTEVLVDAVLPFVRQCVAEKGNCRILDLGTGTGAITLALISQVPQATATATDIAPGALETARKNATVLGLADRFETVLSNWFDAIDGTFDLIVSNPPYIRSDIIAELDVAVREHDPMLALDGGDDGLDAYRAIAAGAAHHLEQNGMIGFEIGFDQAESVAEVFRESGFGIENLQQDLAGNSRVLLAKMRQ